MKLLIYCASALIAAIVVIWCILCALWPYGKDVNFETDLDSKK